MEPRELRTLVARNVRSAAKRKGVALTALADFAGVSRSQVFTVLKSATSPTLDWIAKVATALDLEPWQLLAPRSKKESR